MHSTAGDKGGVERFPFWYALAGVLFSLILGLFVFRFAEDEEARRSKNIAKDQVTLLERKIDRAIGWLEATRGLFHASTYVTNAEFDQFVSALKTDASVQAIEWAPKILSTERATFVRQMSFEHEINFSLTEIGLHGKLIERKKANLYFPVTYLQPQAGNHRALGYDLGSNRDRFNAIHIAMDSGEATVTTRIELVQETEDQYGVLVMLPFRRQGKEPGYDITASKQRDGLILGVIRIGAMLSTLSNDGSNRDLTFDVFDLDAPEGQHRLYPKSGGETIVASASPAFHSDIGVANRRWRVYVSGFTGTSAVLRALTVSLAILFGLAITALVISKILLARRKSIQAQVQLERSRALEKAREEATYQRARHEAGEIRLRAANERIEKKNKELEALSEKLSRYLPSHLCASLVDGHRDAIPTIDRKKLTVMFVDLVGFSAIAEQIQINELSKLLNGYLTDMSNIAARYGGTIDKFIGDGVLVVVGDHASKGVRNDAAACVLMALEMRNRVAEMAASWRVRGVSCPVQCHMGISTGYCAVGNFGSADRLDYTVISSTVNLASRLEKLAAPNTILISEETYNYISKQFACMSEGSFAIRGSSERVNAWQVLAERQSSDRTACFQSQ